MIDPTKTVAIFQRQPEPTTFESGQVIFQQGDAAELMYGIIEGEVDVTFDGRVVETIATGDVFGVGALIDVKQRQYTAIAKTPCKLAFLDRTRFLFAIQETPVFSLSVIKSYSDRLVRIAQMAK